MEYSRSPDGPGSSAGSISYSDAREQAVAILTNRYAEDSLSEAEFEWWLARLSEADTAPRVEALIGELSAPRGAIAARPFPAVNAPPPVRISAFMGTAKRTGPWSVPHRLVVRGVMADLRIDVRQAVIPYPCELELSAMMTQVRIVLPPGVGVDFGVSSMMSSVENNAEDWARVGPNSPRIVVRGRAIMSDVKVEVRRNRL